MKEDTPCEIRFNALCVRFGEQTVISDFSGEIAPGEFVAILGPNGSGKSTLIKSLLGLVKPTSGSIELFGHPPSRGNPLVGYLPQLRNQETAHALSGRAHLHAVLNGHRWGVSRADRRSEDLVSSALHLVDAQEFIDRPYAVLSGGERQRVALAQTLLGQPRLLLLDEALLNLDPRRQQELIAAVDSVRRRMSITVLFVSHDVNPLLESIDRVLYLANGQGALGTVAEVITSETLSKLYRAPIRVWKMEDRLFIIPESKEGAIHDGAVV